mgnify:CR=1 FL=1
MISQLKVWFLNTNLSVHEADVLQQETLNNKLVE